MSEPFVGEIRSLGFNFAPRGWAFCNGQLMACSQNDALFSLLGTIYGGDGRKTFGLPDLRGRIPIHAGSGPGLSPRRLGSKGGAATETLTVNQMPSHAHDVNVDNDFAQEHPTPENNFMSTDGVTRLYKENPTNLTTMSPAFVANNGDSRSHSNTQPYLPINYCIALFGIYPSRR